MKAKVIMPFKDKVTGETNNLGDVIDVTKKRFAEIKNAGNFIEEVKEIKTAVKAEEE